MHQKWPNNEYNYTGTKCITENLILRKRSAKSIQTTLEDSKQSLIVNRCVSIIWYCIFDAMQDVEYCLLKYFDNHEV